MWRWTWKSLLDEPLGLLGSAAGVASAFVLVIFFEGLFAGESGQIVSYLRHAGADVWVAQPGVSNMHMASSFVPDWKQAQIERIPGVRRVTPTQRREMAMKTAAATASCR
ncbi:MAG TPA: hypothetical protein VGA00_01400 [Acidiferrobacterales bacterium]|jgi:hypothetical protein